MKTITLVQRGIAHVPQNPQSSAVELEITTANDTITEVFVKQRRAKQFTTPIDTSFEDVFVAVATPAQIQDLPVSSPLPGFSDFRSNIITLVAENEAALDVTVNIILDEISTLLENLEAQEELITTTTYTVTSSGNTAV